jgi:hypothetical protein
METDLYFERPHPDDTLGSSLEKTGFFMSPYCHALPRRQQITHGMFFTITESKLRWD